MDQQFELISALITVAVLILVPLVYQGYKLLVARYGEAKLAKAVLVARVVVRAVEQIGVAMGWNGPAKKAAALAKARKHGLNLTDEQVSDLLEQAVIEMNIEWGRQKTKELPAPAPTPQLPAG